MMQSTLIPLKFKSKRILCIGDAMVDRYIYGDVTRISPEAPVPILKQTRKESMLGGAGNAALNLKALGAIVDFVTVLGNNSTGHAAAALIEDEIDKNRFHAHIVTECKRITPLKTRLCCQHQQMLRLDCEHTFPISPATERLLIRHLSHAISSCDAVLVSDYDKGMLTPELFETIKSNCDFYNRPLVIDPKKRDFKLYHGATLITPNQSEWNSFGIADINHAFPTNVLITKGADGMELCTHGFDAVFESAAKEVRDVSGAGDTVAAVMTLMLACDADLQQAAYVANIAAGIAVGKAGTTPVTYDELIHAVHQEK